MGYKIFQVKVEDNGRIEYRLDGKLHSLGDMPAVESASSKLWYKEGKLHRENGAAIIYRDGDKVWYKEDRCHREDGPAVVNASGSRHWYYNGNRVSCSSQEEFEDWLKEKNKPNKLYSDYNNN